MFALHYSSCSWLNESRLHQNTVKQFTAIIAVLQKQGIKIKIFAYTHLLCFLSRTIHCNIGWFLPSHCTTDGNQTHTPNISTHILYGSTRKQISEHVLVYNSGSPRTLRYELGSMASVFCTDTYIQTEQLFSENTIDFIKIV